MNRISLLPALCFFGLLPASAAHARPSLTAGAGLTIGYTSIGHPAADASGSALGIDLRAVAKMHHLLSMAVDAWHLRADLGECEADAACVIDRGQVQTALTVGPRLTLPEHVFLQLTLGGTRLHRDDRDAEWEFTVMGEAGYELTRGAWRIELALRHSRYAADDGDTSVHNTAPVLSAHRTW